MSKKNNTNNPAPLNNNPAHMAKMQLAATTTIHQGPLPSPDVLERYDQICPGAAERIIIMAEQQSCHRQTMEARVVNSRCRDSLLGIICGFLIGLATIAGGVYIASMGQPVAGTIFGATGLASLVGVFIYGTSSSRNERLEKSRDS